MGNPNYAIPTDMTGDMGEAFLAALTPDQAQPVHRPGGDPAAIPPGLNCRRAQCRLPQTCASSRKGTTADRVDGPRPDGAVRTGWTAKSSTTWPPTLRRWAGA